MQTANKPQIFTSGEYLLYMFFREKTNRMKVHEEMVKEVQGPHSGHKAATGEKALGPRLVTQRDPQLSGKKSKRWIFNATQFLYSEQQENNPASAV